ncbi:MAG: ThiF family adenylyltransferase [Candidatus Dadabacteria bacterium]|nr:ThiF family adenylyltransferase [Candidatus Dadabacteria bacterium]
MDRFDRQRKIFGDEGQKRLCATTVGIVGGGGLGSFMVLELAYLGIGKIVIIDHDLLEESNRNRLVGAWMSHADGTPKVQILRELGKLIDSEVEIEVIQACIEDPEARDALAGVDIVVGCLDHDGPRSVLNEFCCKHGLPLIDVASDTIPEEDKVAFGGRVCVATPATGCLVCFGVLDQDELQEYYASPEQRVDRDTIYGVPKGTLVGGGPSVITVNGVVASIAATELMVLVTQLRAPVAHQDWRGHVGCLYRVVDHEEDCYYCSLRPVAQE